MKRKVLSLRSKLECLHLLKIISNVVYEIINVKARASSKGPGETAHSRSLTRAFANHTKKRDIDEGLDQFFAKLKNVWYYM